MLLLKEQCPQQTRAGESHPRHAQPHFLHATPFQSQTDASTAPDAGVIKPVNITRCGMGNTHRPVPGAQCRRAQRVKPVPCTLGPALCSCRGCVLQRHLLPGHPKWVRLITQKHLNASGQTGWFSRVQLPEDASAGARGGCCCCCEGPDWTLTSRWRRQLLPECSNALCSGAQAKPWEVGKDLWGLEAVCALGKPAEHHDW